MLKRDLKPGEELHIGDAVIKVVKKHGQVVSLAIQAPREVKIEVKGDEGEANTRKVSVSAS